MNKLDFSSVQDTLEETLVEFDNAFEKKEYPAFQIPEFVPIVSEGGYGNRHSRFGELDGRGSLDDGLIGDSTSSLETVDVNVDLKESPIVTWAKTTTWNIQALYEAMEAGLPLDTIKLENLRENSMQTLQKNGFIGHARDKRIKGLLNSDVVEKSSVVPTKPIDEMDAMEARRFFISIFKEGYKKSGSVLVPNTLAIDSSDLMTLKALEAGNIVNSDGAFVSALSQIEMALSDIAGYEVKIKGIPAEYASKVVKGKNRAIVYTNNEDFLRYNIPVMPETLGTEKLGLLTVQSGMYMRFGGVDFKQPETAAYVDYESTGK